MKKKRIYKVYLDNDKEYYIIANNYSEVESIINNIIWKRFTYSVNINNIEYIAEGYYENN